MKASNFQLTRRLLLRPMFLDANGNFRSCFLNSPSFTCALAVPPHMHLTDPIVTSILVAFTTLFILTSAVPTPLPNAPLPPSVYSWARFLGLSSAFLASVQYAPQLIHTYRSKLVGALSIPMMCIQTPGGVLMVLSIALRPGANWTSESFTYSSFASTCSHHIWQAGSRSRSQPSFRAHSSSCASSGEPDRRDWASTTLAYPSSTVDTLPKFKWKLPWIARATRTWLRRRANGRLCWGIDGDVFITSGLTTRQCYHTCSELSIIGFVDETALAMHVNP